MSNKNESEKYYNKIVNEKYDKIPYHYDFSKSNFLGAVVLYGLCPLCLVVYAPVLIYDSIKNEFLDYKKELKNSILNNKNKELLCAKVFMERYSMNQINYSWCTEINKYTDYLENKYIFPQIIDSYEKTFDKFLVDDKFIKPVEMTKLIEDNISKDVSEKTREFCKKYNIRDRDNYGWYRKTTFIDIFNIFY